METSQQVKEVLTRHRVFLAIIAKAVALRTEYTKASLNLFQEELNKAYEGRRKEIDESPEYTLDQKKVIFKKLQHKLVTKPMQDKHNEEQKINRQLTEMIDGINPDGSTILLTQALDELSKAKDPKEVVLLLSLYNKGVFNETLKTVMSNEKTNSSSSIITLSA
jgi:hypothetical protein